MGPVVQMLTLLTSYIDNTLYFGCRSAGKDEHYADDWRRHLESQNLIYKVAYSRDGIEGTKRIYVQDLIEKDHVSVWNAIGLRDGWVYISGYVAFCSIRARSLL
jgi:sulfite reductase alpha subunit-like flavoprotein